MDTKETSFQPQFLNFSANVDGLKSKSSSPNRSLLLKASRFRPDFRRTVNTLLAAICLLPFLGVTSREAPADSLLLRKVVRPLFADQMSTPPVLRLFAASTNGRGTGATLLASRAVAIDSTGFFFLGAFKCPTSDALIYAVVTRPSQNLSSGVDTSLINAIGRCGSLSALSVGFVDEATTVATVSALAPYLNPATYSIAVNGNEAASLSTAFSFLVNFESRALQYGVNGTSVNPMTVQKLFSLSNLVAGCTGSAHGALCTQFFASSATSPALTAPASILAALQNIAANPTSNVNKIYQLIPKNGVYQPSLSLAPVDWSLSGIAIVPNTVTAPIAPIVSWSSPASISYGVLLSPAQLDATASVPGSFQYSPAAGSQLAVGSHTLSATFTPSDPSHFSSVTSTVSLTVSKAAPTVTWATPAAVAAGTSLSTAQLDAVASIPGTFTYSPAPGTKLSSGSTSLSAIFTPADTTDYTTAAASVIQSVLPSNPLVTDIAIGSTALQTGVKRFGMNIAGQDFYDSGQMLRNLTFRNPGFEGEISQFILECQAVTATSCTDRNPYDVWPADFLDGAKFEFIYGGAKGATGVVSTSTAAGANIGVTLNFTSIAKALAVGDVVIVKMNTPGNGQAGWWTSTQGGGTMTTESADLSPNTPGKQALQIHTSGSGQSASVTSYFDTYASRSFVQLKGTYRIAFRAKGLAGNNQVAVQLQRLATAQGDETFFSQTVTLGGGWQDYTYDFSTSENGSQIGPVALSFRIAGADVLLDDVSLTPATVTSANPTPFRDEVVSTLQALHPGVLRYMDSGADFGSSIDNMIAVPFARQRANHSTQQTEQDDVPLGLHEFLQLCQAVGAEPWFTMPAGMSPTEMLNLVEYLGGDASTPYGARRAALGQQAAWTTVFPVVHLELGNEQWNAASFYGATITDGTAYGSRVATIFGAAKSSPSYSAGSFDLVMGSWAAVPYWTSTEMASGANYDTIAVAPYLFNTFNDTSSNEAVFGPMFAQPEMVDSVSSGYMAQQAKVVSGSGSSGVQPTKLAVYEVGLSAVSGTASQAAVNAAIPSLGAGLAVADHMLLMMRDLGIKTQSVWSLPGINNGFSNPSGVSETTPLFGTVIDMGGSTNLKRPVFLAEQLANSGILSTMLPTAITGANPTWNQALSKNDSIQLNGAHELQSFAFSEDNHKTLIVFNLSRTDALPITMSGNNAPQGTVTVETLTSGNLTDTNEASSTVSLTTSTMSGFIVDQVYKTLPYSMTVFSWYTAN